jgi:hypothetical protein
VCVLVSASRQRAEGVRRPLGCLVAIALTLLLTVFYSSRSPSLFAVSLGRPDPFPLCPDLQEYRRTGFFWEQYQDDGGQGMRGHPFTGWTVLFVNLMAEMY